MALIIDNEPRSYAWGSLGGIRHLRGGVSRAFHTGTSVDGVFPVTDADAPEAELWLGTHPSWPSVVSEGPHAGETLPEALRAEGHPEDVGFLLKLLAIDKPLSLQVHPDAEQAREGFARENAAGIPLDAFERTYRDSNAKPEMVFVLSEQFELCAGFREPAPVIDDLRKAGRLASPETQLFWEEAISHLSGSAPIQTTTEWLLKSGSVQAVRGSSLVSDLLRSNDVVFGLDRDRLLRHLIQNYGNDPGILLSLLLRHETLQRGQALYLQPRTPHFYISGVAVELMGPSDNVLRAGLTSKHVDEAELLKTLAYEPSAPRHLFEYHQGSMTVFHAVGAGLRLAFARGAGGGQLSVPFQPGDIAYVLEGTLRVFDCSGERNVTAGNAVVLIDVQKAIFESPAAGSGMVLVAGKTDR